MLNILLTSQPTHCVEWVGKAEGKTMNFRFFSSWTSKLPVARSILSPWPWSLLPFFLHLHENDFYKHLAKSGAVASGGITSAAGKGQGHLSACPGCVLHLLCHSGDSVSALWSLMPAFAFYSVNNFEICLVFYWVYTRIFCMSLWVLDNISCT